MDPDPYFFFNRKHYLITINFIPILRKKVSSCQCFIDLPCVDPQSMKNRMDPRHLCPTLGAEQHAGQKEAAEQETRNLIVDLSKEFYR